MSSLFLVSSLCLVICVYCCSLSILRVLLSFPSPRSVPCVCLVPPCPVSVVVWFACLVMFVGLLSWSPSFSLPVSVIIYVLSFSHSCLHVCLSPTAIWSSRVLVRSQCVLFPVLIVCLLHMLFRFCFPCLINQILFSCLPQVCPLCPILLLYIYCVCVCVLLLYSSSWCESFSPAVFLSLSLFGFLFFFKSVTILLSYCYCLFSLPFCQHK